MTNNQCNGGPKALKQGTKLCHAAISLDSESRQRQKVIPTNDALSQSGVKHIVITRSAAPFPPSGHCLSSQRAPREQSESSRLYLLPSKLFVKGGEIDEGTRPENERKLNYRSDCEQKKKHSYSLLDLGDTFMPQVWTPE